mmetsp:Transcript_27634/g.35794  ORF Transcript_27634/g.35794 Transcript_27634/m.35794 type:complete len:187 (-) Transcript_27634:284-844(-)
MTQNKHLSLIMRLNIVFILSGLLQAASSSMSVDVSVDGGINPGENNNIDICVNTQEECDFWANNNECQNNPGYMLVECTKACNVCPDLKKAPSPCNDDDKRCPEWALIGECYKNPSYMLMNCPQACRTCHLLDADVRCRPMPGRIAAMKPGDLNETFNRAVSDFPQFSPKVLSSDPWIIVFDTFFK